MTSRLQKAQAEVAAAQLEARDKANQIASRLQKAQAEVAAAQLEARDKANQIASRLQKAQAEVAAAQLEARDQAQQIYEKAAKHGYTVVTDSAQSAAAYYGLRYSSQYNSKTKKYEDVSNCAVFEGAYHGHDVGNSYAVVPHPGQVPVTRPERARRAHCAEKRAERHEVFARIRTWFGRRP